nr:hypothetical protein [uncultured Flavobacterium sp.]
MKFKNIAKKGKLAFYVLSTIALLSITSSCEKDEDNICTPDLTLQIESSSVNNPSITKASVYTDIVINKPIAEVWAVLVDFNKMPSWSTTFKGISGNLVNNSNVSVTYNFLNGAGDVIIPHKLIYSEGVEYGWSDEIIGATGIVDKHLFRVEKISDCQTRFIQSDELTGSNPNITPRDIVSQLQQFYPIFNKELKIQVEK